MTKNKSSIRPRNLFDYLALLTLFVLLASRIIPLFFAHDPWIDEAMLIANLPVISYADLFRPLPLFEQATPLGYLAAAKLVFSGFDDPATGVVALRMLTGLVSVLSAILIYGVARSSSTPALGFLTLIFFALPPFAAKYGLEIKHYTFEMFAMTLLLFAAQRQVMKSSKISMALLTIASVFAILFTYAAPLIIFPVFVGLLATRGVNPIKRPIDSDTRNILICGGGLLAIFTVYYLTYTTRTTAIQFEGYKHIYENAYLTFSSPDIWIKILKIFTNMTWMLGPREIWFAASTILLVMGSYFMVRTSTLLFTTFVVALLSVIGLSLLGLFPILSERHFLFLLPLIAVFLGAGIIQIGILLSGLLPQPVVRGLGVAAVALMLMFSSGLALFRADNVQFMENVTPILHHLEEANANNAPVWVYYGAQPVMRVLAPPQIEQVGLVSHASQVPGWIWQHRDFPDPSTTTAYFSEFQMAIRSRPEIFIVFTHYSVENRNGGRGLDRYREIAEREIGRCKTIDLEGSAILWHCARATSTEHQ